MRWLRRGLPLAMALLAFDCGATREDPTGGETHFLKQCDEDDPAACGSELTCLCGLCTLPCAESSACARFPAADCSARQPSSCEVPSAGFCDVTCTADDDCAWLSSTHTCAAGTCRSAGQPPSACPSSQVQANEVVVLGDVFFAATHAITAFLEQLARQDGALGPGERYRDASSVTGNTLALAGNGIEQQYVSALTENPVRVAIMTGGGADVLLGSCATVDADCPLLVAAADAARSLLQRMADDGVEHVVYAFYPDPADPALRDEVDALRPLLEAVCATSAVPCHWVDLRQAFAGKQDSYLDASGTTPTAEGAAASASQIWAIMKQQCVAQSP